MEIVKECKKHGKLNKEQCYYRKNKDAYECRECMRDREKKRPKRAYEGEFAEYHRNYAKKWRQENVEAVNEKIRQDRLINPEKYREQERKKRLNNIERYRMLDRLQKRKITEQEYIDLMNKGSNLCYICKKEETRLSKSGNEICSLIVDHCHECESRGIIGIRNVRGILCHSCNMLVRRDIKELPGAAIAYLESHKHESNSVPEKKA